MAEWDFVDKRGRTSSGMQVKNLAAEMARLKQAGYALPKSQTGARMETARVLDQVNSKGAFNRQITAEFNRRRLEASTKVTGANIQMALSKLREPGMSLADKGIPFDIQNPEELRQIRAWCRLFYATHDLIPLLIDIYSKFPLVGLEFDSKDPEIKEFYEKMFLDELKYQKFLPMMGREYFTVGEVTSLAHFNESLGIWSSEEILNPDQLIVSKSIFVDRERVQLLVKDMVDALRDGPQRTGMTQLDETDSQRMEREDQYKMLQKYYPEIIEAAQREDGLDLSDALVSRLTNKANDWDLYGTPIMLRSFRTLMMEESLNAAQDAVADRLYSPLILAKLGVPDLGDHEPWIPDQSDLDACRDDLQSALAADFRLMVSNFGLEVDSVFGREVVPRFDQDYDRIDAKLLQAWGIGEALIAGGSGAGGAYASSALNREFVTLMMEDFQNLMKEHILKRASVIAEAQEHYDYELKGGIRRPLYRYITQENPETGEEEIIKVPKLLLPEVRFATLNLRDEAVERQFVQALKGAGVPISDRILAVGKDLDFEQELERSAEETYKKLMAQAQAMDKAKAAIDAQGLVGYPPELAQYLQATVQLRAGLAGAKMAEDQESALDAQTKQQSPAGQMGLLPGTTAAQPQPQGQQSGQQKPGDKPKPPAGQGGGGQAGAPQQGGQQNPQAQQIIKKVMPKPKQVQKTLQQFPGVPVSGSPTAVAPTVTGVPMPGQGATNKEPPRNRARPAESDSQRAGAPKAASKGKLNGGPSSYRRSQQASEQAAERAVRRREVIANHVPKSVQPRVEDLISDPNFFIALNIQHHEPMLQGEFGQIVAGKSPAAEKILREALEQYEEIFGVTPEW